MTCTIVILVVTSNRGIVGEREENIVGLQGAERKTDRTVGTGDLRLLGVPFVVQSEI